MFGTVVVHTSSSVTVPRHPVPDRNSAGPTPIFPPYIVHPNTDPCVSLLRNLPPPLHPPPQKNLPPRPTPLAHKEPRPTLLHQARRPVHGVPRTAPDGLQRRVARDGGRGDQVSACAGGGGEGCREARGGGAGEDSWAVRRESRECPAGREGGVSVPLCVFLGWRCSGSVGGETDLDLVAAQAGRTARRVNERVRAFMVVSGLDSRRSIGVRCRGRADWDGA